ncbi:MAG TPA: metallophosphoesterase [Chloroflexota bacterium]|nr:metallophosphoesterase [Chloroflexota bacterium]
MRQARRRVPPVVGAAVAAAGLGVLAYAALVEPRRLQVVHRRVPVRGLPPALAGLRVLHLSDLHIGALHCGSAHVRAAASVPADLVAVTGDLVQGTRAIPYCADLLGALQAPLGVYVVLGNHDYSYPGCAVDTEALVAALRARGIRVLRNTAAPVQRGGATLWLAGVDDPHRRRHDVAAALASVPDAACVVLLAHSPDVLRDVPPGRVALALVGHTHGGQVRLPGLPALVTNTRLRLAEPHGLQWVCGTLVHLHAGLGNIIPLRFGIRPEAVVLELQPAPHCPAAAAVHRAARLPGLDEEGGGQHVRHAALNQPAQERQAG